MTILQRYEVIKQMIKQMTKQMEMEMTIKNGHQINQDFQFKENEIIANFSEEGDYDGAIESLIKDLGYTEDEAKVAVGNYRMKN